MSKYLHVKDNTKYLAMQKGYVYPVNFFECVPGSVVSLKTEAILETQPMINPLLHPTHHYIYHFYVPYSALYPSFNRFISGEQNDEYFSFLQNADSNEGLTSSTSLVDLGGHASLNPSSKVLPQIQFKFFGTIGGHGQNKINLRRYQAIMLNSFWRHFGVYTSYTKEYFDSLGDDGGVLQNTITMSPASILAYIQIYNEFFRDKDLDLCYDHSQISRAVKALDDGTSFYVADLDEGTANSFRWSVTFNKGECIDVDYMKNVVALISVFLGDMFKDYLSKIKSTTTWTDMEIYTPILFKVNSEKDYFTTARPYEKPNNISDLTYHLDSDHDGDVDKDDIITIKARDIRVSEALQKLWEHRLSQGYTMRDYLRRNFGERVYQDTSNMVRYLGGSKNTMDYFKVMGTSGDNLATKGGNSTTYSKHRGLSFRPRFHGFIFTVSFIRYNNIYLSGVEHYHLKRGNLDFFTPEIAGLGKDQIKVAELFLDQSLHLGATTDLISGRANQNWGFKDLYDENRTELSRVLSQECVQSGGLWKNWYLGEFFGGGNHVEALNSAFIKQRNNTSAFININENLNGANQFAMIYNRYRVRNTIRINPKYSL